MRKAVGDDRTQGNAREHEERRPDAKGGNRLQVVVRGGGVI